MPIIEVMAYEAWRDSNDIGARRLLTNPDAAPGPLMIVRQGECWCGCGTKTSRPGRYFTSGHNTVFRGRLDRAEAAGVPVTVNGLTMAAAEWREMLVARPAAVEKARRVVRERRRRILFLLAQLDDLGTVEINELADLTGYYFEHNRAADIDALHELAREVVPGHFGDS